MGFVLCFKAYFCYYLEMPLNDKFLKPYNPQETESKIYKLWEESGFFNPDNLPGNRQKPYTVIMPPPNVTGVLHMGHALMLTLEDILIRYKRMRGFKTLWLPGTDHAAIATQSRVEKDIYKKEGKSRHDLGREEFLKRVTTFAKESHDTIVSQIKVMGASCDWSREAFTLDEKRNLAVRTMFKMMYDDGLIYRGNRIVNWDPKGQTTISDDEIVYEERKAKLYTFRYSKDFPIPIATTRPETKLGDVGIAVHPEGKWKKYIGQIFEVENFAGVKLSIKIVGDTEVDQEFGTGAVGLTPAHSHIDWEMAERHNLDKTKIIINEYAKMTDTAGTLVSGKKATEAREIVVAWLTEGKLLEKEEEISQNVATAERTGGIVEPLPKLQWFLDVNKPIKAREGKTLKDLMREAVKDGGIKILPEYFEKTYFHWIENLRDWCISRQIWYGHRIPVWYDGDKVVMPEERHLFFARHSQSEYQEKGLYTGQKNPSITEKGRLEASEIGKKLIGKGIQKILCSDLGRTKETAEIINKYLKVKIEYIKELREVSAGKLEGKQKIEGKPILVAMIDDKTGETEPELILRAENAWKIIQSQKEEKILIVGHQTFNSVLFAVAENNSDLYSYRKKWKQRNTDIFEKTILIPPDKKFEQDPDTLDTWFSSGLWTFSTLGWPHYAESATRGKPGQENDFTNFHPTDVLETGYEILFFWVARMILMSEYALGTIPFHTVYLHGTVRDGQGRKMSKSLGNGIDPIDVAKKFGTDAGRMALIIGNTAGTDTKISEDKIRGYKNFANKIWNVARFILENTDGVSRDEKFNKYTTVDVKLNDEIKAILTDVTKDMEDYRLYMAAEKIYHYIWHTLADKIIEESKNILKEGTETEKISRQQFLLNSLKKVLVTIHPFMPFVTEEIWQNMGEKNLIMVENWPNKNI